MHATSTKVSKPFPKFRPRFAKPMAHEDIWMIDSLFIFHAEIVPDMRGQAAGNKFALKIAEIRAHHNQRLRRRIVIAALPERINSADRARKPALRTIKTDGAGLAVICSHNTQIRAILRRQRLAKLSNG